MDSYVSFLTEKIKLGADSLRYINLDIHKKIVSSVSSSEGGAVIRFKPLNPEIFKEKTACFDSPVPYGDESYIVETDDEITIYYTSEITKIYALYAIKRHYDRDGICKGIIYNTPKLEFRCVRMYLPGKKRIDEFKEFLDMMLSFGYNTVMLEIGGAMEYKRHPEISEGWVEYCKIFEEFNGKTEYIQRMTYYPKNAIHSDNGEGEYLTYEELTQIVDYCREHHMEIIPEVPTFCHVDYLLYNHPELSELPDDPLPNNACPSNEDYYKLIFDVLDEIIEVFKPKRINICHDEAYVYGHCPKCKGKSGAELFGGHIVRLHDYLAKKGVRTMLWGDGIISTWHGGNAAYHKRMPWDGKRTVTYNGVEYKVRNFKCHSPEEWAEELKINPDSEYWYCEEKHRCMDFLPKDIEAMNWMWAVDPDSDNNLIKHGIYTVYGNFNAIGMKNFDERISKGIKGLSYSNWGRNDFEALQRTGTLFGMAINSFATWNHNYDESKREENVFFVCSSIYNYMNYNTLHGKHLEITHTTDAVIDHDIFIDGYLCIHEDYKIGEYEITYTDSSRETVGIYWGYNIGQKNICYKTAEEAAKLSVECGGYVTKYQYEPIGVSCPVSCGNEMYYKMVIPVDKAVAKIELKPYDGFNIDFKGYVIK